MSNFDLHILGCGSATPSMRHLPSCQALTHRGRVIMIDCGEGAQLALRRQGLSFARITDIFISHLHGDHLLGLPGLLSTIALHADGSRRRVRVHIFAEGAQMMSAVLPVVSHPSDLVDIDFNILDPRGGQTIAIDNGLTATTFALNHTVPCVGFRFDEPPKPRHLLGDVANFYGIPTWQRQAVKNGANFVTADGRVIPNAQLTGEPSPSVSYAYCSDTLYDPELIVPAIRGVDVLYHEATYLASQPGMEAAARARGHCTAAQAAEIARQAGARRLILGHFSNRYNDAEGHLAEARPIFGNVIAADEGLTVNLSSPS